MSKSQTRKCISITSQTCDATPWSYPIVQGNNLLEMSTINMVVVILAFKCFSHFQTHKDNLVQNKISENVSYPCRKVAHIAISLNCLALLIFSRKRRCNLLTTICEVDQMQC